MFVSVDSYLRISRRCLARGRTHRDRPPKAWAETTGSLCAVMVGLAAASKEEVVSEATLSSVEKGISSLKAGGVGADFIIEHFGSPFAIGCVLCKSLLIYEFTSQSLIARYVRR